MLQQIVDKLESSYDLCYTDYNDHFEQSPDEIQKCIENKSPDHLDENNDWRYDNQHEWANQVIEDLELNEAEQEWIDDPDNRSEVMDAIHDRDSSSPIQDMLDRTDLPARLMLFSNYDVMNSNYYITQSWWYEYDDIFKQIVDALNLNPFKLLQHIWEYILDWSEWPNIPDRDGNEYVSYEDFVSELNESIGTCNNLTFLWMLNAWDISYKDEWEYYTVTIPKWNSCGLFDHCTGSWSMLDCTLLRDFTVTLDKWLESEYDFYKLIVDDSDVGYGINQTYGLTREAWWYNLKIS